MRLNREPIIPEGRQNLLDYAFFASERTPLASKFADKALAIGPSAIGQKKMLWPLAERNFSKIPLG